MADARSERHPAVRPQAAHPEERRKGNFIAESWGELKKVEWPNQNQVIQGTVVVLVACVVVGSFLYLNDIVWKHVVSRLFLGQ
jgi:preprotein translocase subunit SecE